jgi:hypothetical protein
LFDSAASSGTHHFDETERSPSVWAVEAARLLQAAAPIAATFTAPFSVGPDPDEDGSLRPSVATSLRGARIRIASEAGCQSRKSA